MSKRQHIDSEILGLDLNSEVKSSSLEEFEYERNRNSKIIESSSSSSDSDDSDSQFDEFKFPVKRSRRSAVIKKTPDQVNMKDIIPKSQTEISFLARSLSHSFIFANLDYSDLLQLISSMYLRKYLKGSNVVHKDDESSELFVIKSGKIKIEIGENTAEEIGTGVLIGEISLLHDTPHIVEAVAVEDSECWTLDRSTFIKLAHRTTSHRRNKFKSLIRKVFSISLEETEKLVDGCKLEVFCTGEFIARRGINTGKLFVIYEGGARNLSQENFEFVWEENLNESVVAESITKCFSLTKASIERILGLNYKNYIRRTG